MKLLPCAGLLLLGLTSLDAVTFPPARLVPMPGDEEELVRELKLRMDDADPDLVRKLANLKTHAALDGLLEVYDVMNSIYMRRAVLRGIALFDGVAGEEQRALQKMMDAATQSSEREMREIAVNEIAGCRHLGHAFLAMIVESAASDDVRELAMLHHTGDPRPGDEGWYLGIYDPSRRTSPPPSRGKPKKNPAGEEAEPAPFPLPVLRELAFEVLCPNLDAEELAKAARGGNRVIQMRAIRELYARGDGRGLEFARRLYTSGGVRAEDRLAAAALLFRAAGTKEVEKFIKEATRPGESETLSFGIADLVADLHDPKVTKLLLKKVGKGKGLEKLFYLRAARKLESEKLDKVLVRLLKDKDPRVVRSALEVIAERRDTAALPAIRKLFETTKQDEVVGDCLDAISSLRAGDSAWIEELVGFAADERTEIRNAAIARLGETGNPAHLPLLSEALHDAQWSTRLAAARALRELHVKEAVGALCAQIPKETGRMAIEMGNLLFELTGKTFRAQGRLWAKWWEEEGEGFELISDADLRRLRRELEARRLREVSRSEFFGIRIESHRVIFILDVSGSMEQRTREGRYSGKGAIRLDVARRELGKALDSLDLNSLFNMIVFAGDVESWRDTISPKTAESLEDAKGFVARLRAGGGTNLFGALRLAFEDPEADTLIVLSDGEPSVGVVTDPGGIRAAVAEWNKHRGVVIHCVAVGGSLSILEHLAGDSGGTYVRFQ